MGADCLRARSAASAWIGAPARRALDFHGNGVRAAMREALNDLARAPAERSRGASQPVQAQALGRDFDLGFRWQGAGRRLAGCLDVLVFAHRLTDARACRRIISVALSACVLHPNSF